MSMMREWGLYDNVWQAGAILLPIRSVGVMGDERTYEYTIALRAVTSTDAMSADWAHLPYEFLAKVSNEIINKVRGVNLRHLLQATQHHRMGVVHSATLGLSISTEV